MLPSDPDRFEMAASPKLDVADIGKIRSATSS